MVSTEVASRAVGVPNNIPLVPPESDTIFMNNYTAVSVAEILSMLQEV